MAAPVSVSFDDWLSKKLFNLNADVDLEVFVSYIHGILDTDDNDEDKMESISGLLGGIVEEDLEVHCGEILQKWSAVSTEHAQTEIKAVADFNEQVSSIIESQQVKSVKTQSKKTDEDKQRKAAILAQFAAVSDDDSSDGEQSKDESSAAADKVSRNVNTSSVDERVRAERDVMKAEHEQRRAREREQLAEQRTKAAVRKESEKKRTQKSEKRR